MTDTATILKLAEDHPDRVSVHVCGMVRLENGDETCADDPAQADFWLSYVRVETPDDPQQPFTTGLENRIPMRMVAEMRAAAWAAVLLGDGTAWEMTNE